MSSIPLPPVERLRALARRIERALAEGDRARLESECGEFARATARAWGIARPKVRVLAARPRRVYGDSTIELYGDYDPESAGIRVWMRTAVHKRVTAYGTFLSTLCHELCHHLDVARLDLPDTPHTRGFYERAALLYHHARGTPYRELSWIPFGRGQFRIDWQKMRARK
jgi:hypothetical protein